MSLWQRVIYTLFGREYALLERVDDRCEERYVVRVRYLPDGTRYTRWLGNVILLNDGGMPTKAHGWRFTSWRTVTTHHLWR